MTAMWFYAIDGQRRGPAPWSDLQRLREMGELSEQSLVWQKGMKDWQPLGEMSPPPLPTPVSNVAVSPPPVQRPQPVAKSESRQRKRRSSAPASVSFSKGQLAGLVVGVVLATAVLSAWIAVIATRSADKPNQRSDDRVAAVVPPVRLTSPPVSRADQESAQSDSRGADRREASLPREVVPVPFESAFPVIEEESTEPISVESVPPTPTVDEQPDPPTSGNPPAKEQETNKESAQPPAVTKQKLAFPWLGAELFQEANVRRRPSFTMIGRPIAMSQDYQILSLLKIGEAAADGSFPVTQAILDTKLHGADDLSRGAMAADLKNLIGDQFGYRVHPAHGILDFARGGDKAKAAAIKTDSVEGMFTGAAMDDDGWRELAHLTFLQPPEPLKQGVSWRRQLMHNWNSLGAWTGETEFQFAGKRKGSEMIKYTHVMNWQPPVAGAKASLVNIVSARFEAAKASGMVEYDSKQQRVLAAEEVFEVQGEMQAEMAGQKIPIKMTESQSLGIRVLDQNPWRQ